MPIQINEVIVRAVVDPTPSTGAKQQGPDCPPSGNSGGQDMDLMEKVLEIINEKHER